MHRQNAAQQQLYISHFSDQGTGRKTEKSCSISRRKTDYSLLQDIQPSSASKPESRSVGRGNLFAEGKAAEA